MKGEAAVRYPTVTRILAIFLALCSLGLAGAAGFGLYTGSREKRAQLKELSEIKSQAEEYRSLDLQLNGDSKAEEMDRKLKSDSEKHVQSSSEHRRELAEYSAGKSGVQIGSQALTQGDDKLFQGWEQYYKALDMLKEKEQEFKEGYAGFQAGLTALEASKKLYDGAVQALEGAKGIVNELETLDQVFENGDLEEAYDRILTACERGLYAIQQAENILNSMLEQGLISSEQLEAIENEIIAATGMSSGEIKAKLQADYEYLLNSGGLTQEQFEELKAVYDENRAALAAVAAVIKKYLPPAEEKLKAMGEELRQAQARVDEMKPLIEQGKAALEEGRKGLAQAESALKQGEDALISGEKKLNEEQGKLNEKLPELQEQKEKLEEEQRDIERLTEDTEQRKSLEGKRTSLSLQLRSIEPIRESFGSGTELYAAAQDYIVSFEKEINGSFANRILMAVIMGLGAAAGLCCPIFFFGRERGRRQRLVLPAVCAALSAAALLMGIMGLDFVSSSSVTVICAAAALVLFGSFEKKKKEI